MKTIRLFGFALLTVLLSVGFTACSSDSNNEEESPYNPFVGTWYGEGYYADDPTLHGYTFTFESNYYGTYVISKDVNEFYGSPKGFTYKTRGTDELCLYYTKKGDGDSLVFRYKITPNTLSLEKLTYKTLIPKHFELKKQ